MKKVLVPLLALVILVGGGMGAYRWYQNNNQRTQFRTVSMERGDLLATINATGTVEPEEVIDVGAQVVGQIRSFGRDPRDSSKLIDFGSPVEEGTVLAQIDDSVYASQVEISLGYCTIRSPVKGVIVDRRVNVGQTVVSSLNAPSLFLLAKDLRRLQIWASVNEADIGNIHPGQKVTFTVDAFPNQKFQG